MSMTKAAIIPIIILLTLTSIHTAIAVQRVVLAEVFEGTW